MGFIDYAPRERRPHPVRGESRTRQSDALESDINKIVAKYRATGIVMRAPGTARYGDFASGLDYKTAIDRVRAAEADFWDLPVEIRNAAENDPGKFIDMVQDEEGRDKLLELGLDVGRDPTLAEAIGEAIESRYGPNKVETPEGEPEGEGEPAPEEPAQ